MRPGTLRDRITIQSPGSAKDTSGAPKRVWSDVWTCAAEIATVSGREYFTGNREEAQDVVRIRIRHPPHGMNVTADHRAFDSRRGYVYAITAVLFDDKRTLMTLVCQTGVRDG